ncbi:DEKNAAC105438 [Brettanomyces naardenensis]|uniref:DEKNAAC105438 n=1 Tax=Brettanomyces naardenensis TaxID=13370 RepID=A0A448YTG8_BRENA|nr:DEKNAAC105438 [Brettanomyces naardenensis]
MQNDSPSNPWAEEEVRGVDVGGDLEDTANVWGGGEEGRDNEVVSKMDKVTRSEGVGGDLDDPEERPYQKEASGQVEVSALGDTSGLTGTPDLADGTSGPVDDSLVRVNSPSQPVAASELLDSTLIPSENALVPPEDPWKPAESASMPEEGALVPPEDILRPSEDALGSLHSTSGLVEQSGGTSMPMGMPELAQDGLEQPQNPAGIVDPVGPAQPVSPVPTPAAPAHAASPAERSHSPSSFGSFESTRSLPKLQIQSMDDLISQILPHTVFLADSTQHNGEEILSKCREMYTRITASQRQYGLNSAPVANFRSRGYWSNSEVHREMNRICQRWNEVENNLDRRNEDVKEFGGTNIFQWSSKEKGNRKEGGESVQKGIEQRKREREELLKKQLNRRLLNSSFVEARKIVEERLAKEKEEEIRLGKEREERVLRLEEERRKKEVESRRYLLGKEEIEKVKVKKRGFFGRLFGGKSRIARDHEGGGGGEAVVVQEDDDFAAFTRQLGDGGDEEDEEDEEGGDTGYNEVLIDDSGGSGGSDGGGGSDGSDGDMEDLQTFGSVEGGSFDHQADSNGKDGTESPNTDSAEGANLDADSTDSPDLDSDDTDKSDPVRKSVDRAGSATNRVASADLPGINPAARENPEISFPGGSTDSDSTSSSDFDDFRAADDARHSPHSPHVPHGSRLDPGTFDSPDKLIDL